jgi:hypothetical protein
MLGSGHVMPGVTTVSMEESHSSSTSTDDPPERCLLALALFSFFTLNNPGLAQGAEWAVEFVL